MPSSIETMQKLLQGLYEEVEENEYNVRKNGHVPSELCDKCDRKQWDIIPLTPQQHIILEKFTFFLSILDFSKNCPNSPVKLHPDFDEFT